ncbi:hypothetical protein GCM10025794_35650 [Massilia kyonggiensis]
MGVGNTGKGTEEANVRGKPERQRPEPEDIDGVWSNVLLLRY